MTRVSDMHPQANGQPGRMNWIIREEGFREERFAALGNRFLIGNGYLGVRGTLDEDTKEYMPAINLAGVYDQVGDGWREPVNAPNGLYSALWLKDPCGRWKSARPSDPSCMDHYLSLDFQHGLLKRGTVWYEQNTHISMQTERFASMTQRHLIGAESKVTCKAPGKAAGYSPGTQIRFTAGIDGDVWDLNGPHFDSFIHRTMPFAAYGAEEDRTEKGCRDWLLITVGTTHESHEKVTVVQRLTVSVDTGGEDAGSVPLRISRINDKESRDGSAGDDERGSDSLNNLLSIEAPLKEWQKLTLTRMNVIYTTKDDNWDEERAIRLLREASFEQARTEHKQSWEDLWEMCFVEIDGDNSAMQALNYSIYHLLSIAPERGSGHSIPARGLSGQTYKGAVFWDTEMFMLDLFLFTDPPVAKSLMKYRVDTLQGAKNKAKEYGYDGAFYAWESQEGGYDGCTNYNVVDVFSGRPMRTYFRDKQYHISAAVAYGILHYTDITGDESLLKEGGAETVIECAKFYYSLLVKRVSAPFYEIRDAIGPDEYHERINNNAYTNRMASYVLKEAAKLLRNGAGGNIGERNSLADAFEDGASRLMQQKPDESGIIPQFDGYMELEDASLETVRGRLLHEKEYWGGAYGVASHTKVIKQADVVTMLNLFPGDFPLDVQKKNWEYYEPWTEHGSSLSACMYALLACRCGMPEKAYPFFIKSARADLNDGGKEWAGLVYIGGTHPASAGGAYMTAIEGFGGVSVENGELKVRPQLPPDWKGMAFRLCVGGRVYSIRIAGDQVSVEAVDENNNEAAPKPERGEEID